MVRKRGEKKLNKSHINHFDDDRFTADKIKL